MSDTPSDTPAEDHGEWRRLKIPAGQTPEQAMAEQGITPPPDEPEA
jgi:hypothetical protein